jgi:hypothetical protein
MTKREPRRTHDRPRTALPIVGGVVGAVLGATWSRRRNEAHAVAALLRRPRPVARAPVAAGELDRLPEPVARWLRASGVVGAPIPAVVYIEQEGRLRTGAGSRWLPFRARQWATSDPPGFLWLARASLGPGVWVGIRDAFDGDHGRSGAALWGLVPAGAATGPEIDAASLQRWLGELGWLPAAALDGRIAWRQTGPDEAEATMTVGAATASVAFAFDGAGRLRRVEADRWRADVGAVQRWRVYLSGWTPRGGIVAPSVAEAVWDDPAGAFTAFQLRIGAAAVVR